eukprot:8927433-Pyramimonas_sp.AAC.1
MAAGDLLPRAVWRRSRNGGWCCGPRRWCRRSQLVAAPMVSAPRGIALPGAQGRGLRSSEGVPGHPCPLLRAPPAWAAARMGLAAPAAPDAWVARVLV